MNARRPYAEVLLILLASLWASPPPLTFAQAPQRPESQRQATPGAGASPAQATLAPASSRAPTAELQAEQRLTRIAFGSCAHQNRPQPIWHAIADLKPDLFIFTGDNVYADTKDMAKLRADYAKLDAMPGLARLRAQGCPILATWDDHDFGNNDAGEEWEMKRQSQQVFFDWLGVPSDATRRQREGVYDARIVGPQGSRVQIITLDTRTFRSPLVERGPELARAYGQPGPYTPTTDTTTTLLGPAQWEWLARELRADADLRIIVSSVQFVAEEHRFESWANFPHERARMVRLIAESGARGVVFISGDRHHAEISRLDDTAGPASPPYPIWDVTSSPLNQTKRWGNEHNRHRMGGMYSDPNFGVIEIDWTTPDPRVSLQIRDVEGTPLMIQDVSLSTLRPKR